jgi:enediyne biosynthesis protein E5
MSAHKTFSGSQARKRAAMKTQAKIALMSSSQSRPHLLFALWYFSIMLVLWTVLGQTVLGFKQSWAAPVVGLTTAILMQVLVEWLTAKSREREPGFISKPGAMANVLPASIVPGLACTMLIYPNEHLWPVIFAVAVAIGSKFLFRAPADNGRPQRIFNPSSLGIATTVLLFPWVGFVPPDHFNDPTGLWHWVFPAIVLLSGFAVHLLSTGRLLLCLAWVGGFVLQAVLRHWLLGSSFIGAIVPMTSAAFIIFTLCMIPDSATTPVRLLRQVVFGFSVAMVYGVLQVMHIGYGFFFALTIVSAARGIALYVLAGRKLMTSSIAVPFRSQRAVTGD